MLLHEGFGAVEGEGIAAVVVAACGEQGGCDQLQGEDDADDMAVS